MTSGRTTGTYPRKLRTKELDALETVLPADRAGYQEYRNLLSKMIVLGEGRRGPGNLVLGFERDRPDTSSPLAPVIAYGMVETTQETFTITLREYVGDQIDVEIVSAHGDEIPDHYEEKRRWTYSAWKPGEPLPSNFERVREVNIDRQLTLGIAVNEKRILLYDAGSGIVYLIPITNFYNELMLHKSIRDPKIALKSSLFFHDLDRYSDEDARAAFIAYNKLKRRVSVVETPPVTKEKSVTAFLRTLFGRQNG